MLKVTGRAEAANNDPLTVGVLTNVSTSQTQWNVATANPGFQIVRNGIAGGSATCVMQVRGETVMCFFADTALGGFSNGTVRGSNSSAGVGVLGDSIGEGVRGAGLSNSTGVKGVSNSNSTISGEGTGSGVGVFGRSSSGRGVQGEATTGTGVRGFSNTAAGTSDGNGTGTGAHGRSGTGVGVLGEVNVVPGAGVITTAIKGVSGVNTTGVKGVSNTGNNLAADGTGSGIGVHGKSTGGPGVRGDSVNAPGVEGVSVNSLGVRGISTNFTAMVGISTNNHGLYGSTSSAGSAGFVGENLAGGLAGYFAGNVFVTGSLQVAGAKNAVIKMQDGTLGSVYCQESPEPYFEDFGEGRLVGGVAQVALEPEFASLVAGGKYMVFPIPEGDTRGLYVSRKAATGFEVREVQGGTGSVAFTYRIVTKRKDIEGRRFARVTDTVAPGLAAARAAMGVTGTPTVNNAPSPSPVTPPPFVPQPNPAPGPVAPNQQPQNNNTPGVNPNQPGFIIPPAGSAP